MELYLSTKTKLKSTAIVYLIPVLGIFVGAFSAEPLSKALGLNPSLGMAMFTFNGTGFSRFSHALSGQPNGGQTGADPSGQTGDNERPNHTK